jgi:hypothetical protein
LVSLMNPEWDDLFPSLVDPEEKTSSPWRILQR